MSSNYKKEIFITEPTKAITKIHDELITYKDSYKNLSENLKQTTRKIERYESLINVINIK